MTTKKKATKRRPVTLRSALNQVEKLLLTPGVRQELWDVLTALRGPDTGDDAAKEQVTVHIRNAAFPRLAARGNGGTSGVGAMFGALYVRSLNETRAELEKRTNWHFIHHARVAARALGVEVFRKEGV